MISAALSYAMMAEPIHKTREEKYPTTRILRPRPSTTGDDSLQLVPRMHEYHETELKHVFCPDIVPP